MKISQTQINFNSQHIALREEKVQENLLIWKGERPSLEANLSPASSRIAISEAARQAALNEQNQATQNNSQVNSSSPIDEALTDIEDDANMQFLIRLVEALTGRKIRLFSAAELGETAKVSNESNKMATENAPPAQQGWGVEYTYYASVRESETTQFNTQGVVHTADGKEIRFQLSLEMHRDFYSETHVSFRAGDARTKDPLVINFNGNAAELTEQKFDFDLDSDGTKEKISFVGQASGFLALDKNGNGKIDDGSELFGTESGNGFLDLAIYDEDGNGWIDENDAIFAKLLIWSKDASGQDILTTLAERNIGAIYLGHTETPFNLKDAQNTQHGQILSSGIYLNEDGTAGTVQQVDLVV